MYLAIFTTWCGFTSWRLDVRVLGTWRAWGASLGILAALKIQGLLDL